MGSGCDTVATALIRRRGGDGRGHLGNRGVLESALEVVVIAIAEVHVISTVA